MVLGMSLSDAYNSIVIDMVNARVGAQRELIGLLKHRGYETSRSSDSRGVADIVAAKVGPSEAGNRKFMIQVRATADEMQRVAKTAIRDLKESAGQFQSTPVFAIRFCGERWRFWSDEQEGLDAHAIWLSRSSAETILDSQTSYVGLDVTSRSGRTLEQVF